MYLLYCDAKLPQQALLLVQAGHGAILPRLQLQQPPRHACHLSLQLGGSCSRSNRGQGQGWSNEGSESNISTSRHSLMH